MFYFLLSWASLSLPSLILSFFFFYIQLCIFPLAQCTFVQLRCVIDWSDSYRLHLPGAVLDPLQVDITKAGPRHPLQAVHVVLIDLHAEDLWVALNVVPLGVGLQRLLDGGVLQPGGQFGWVDQKVDDALNGEGREGERLFRLKLVTSSITACWCQLEGVDQKHSLVLLVWF